MILKQLSSGLFGRSLPENMKRVPSEDLAALPKDGLNQIDHYVYGVPKIEP
jgi:hypothetical protein